MVVNRGCDPISGGLDLRDKDADLFMHFFLSVVSAVTLRKVVRKEMASFQASRAGEDISTGISLIF